jgi:succinate dehydrogenase / fumarate reductase, iron-sulfur subunit
VEMVLQHDEEGFGHCTMHGACQNACPKNIKVDYISRLNADMRKASVRHPAGS